MITFGIITNKDHHSATDQSYRMSKIIDSIEQQEFKNYEIIIVGDYTTTRKNTKCIYFDDNIKRGWITKKKNIITKESRFYNIVYMHDYIIFDKYWKNGWDNFGWDHWDLAMNVIENKDGTRFRDWCVIKFDGNIGKNGIFPLGLKECCDCTISPYLADYNYNRTENMYISGSYWITKKRVMIEEPLNEDLVWGQPEDIEWSFRVLSKYNYVMNSQSKVKLLHQKDPVWKELE